MDLEKQKEIEKATELINSAVKVLDNIKDEGYCYDDSINVLMGKLENTSNKLSKIVDMPDE